MIRRRFLLDRDPEEDWPTIFNQIRSFGYGTADICFTLNISRNLLWNWESRESKPNFENGRAVLKFLATLKVVKKSETNPITKAA